MCIVEKLCLVKCLALDGGLHDNIHNLQITALHFGTKNANETNILCYLIAVCSLIFTVVTLFKLKFIC